MLADLDSWLGVVEHEGKMKPTVSYDWSEETPKAKARWFQLDEYPPLQ
jgi:hypothetical protein